MTSPRVALVATVLNEYGSLPGWFEGLRSQSRCPDEVIIVDGGSSDGTIEYLESVEVPFPITVMCAPGCNISEGRNLAISRTASEIVLVTDAGTVAASDWIDRLVRPLERDSEIDLVAGFFEPEARSLWTEALAAATLPDAVEIDPEKFLPSSRSVAFRRRWFDEGFVYPEWLDYCEDLIFDLQLRRAGARQFTDMRAVVRFEPRGGPSAFFRQYYRYARGDGKAGLFVQRHLIRYATYLGATILLFRRRPFELIAGALAGLFYVSKVARRLRRRRMGVRHPLPMVMALGALQIALGDIAKMAGYPAGLFWRLRRDRTFKLWKSGWATRLPSGRLPPT